MLKIQSTTVNFKNIELYTESIGNRTNPAVLLISGSMNSAKFWNDEACKMLVDAGFFVIRYDHRDTGLSSPVDYDKNPYQITDLAGDAIAILDFYNVKKAKIIGGSMGGLIAQLIAIDYPEKVSDLVLISSAVFAKADLTDEEMKNLTNLAEKLGQNRPTKNFEQSIDGFLAFWQNLHGDILIDNDIATNFTMDMYKRTRPENLEWLDLVAKGIDPAHNHEKLMLSIPDRTEDLKKIKIPVTVIHGKKDFLIPIRLVQENLIAHIPHAKFHAIEKMGHIVFNRDLFKKIISLSILGNL